MKGTADGCVRSLDVVGMAAVVARSVRQAPTFLLTRTRDGCKTSRHGMINCEVNGLRHIRVQIEVEFCAHSVAFSTVPRFSTPRPSDGLLFLSHKLTARGALSSSPSLESPPLHHVFSPHLLTKLPRGHQSLAPSEFAVCATDGSPIFLMSTSAQQNAIRSFCSSAEIWGIDIEALTKIGKCTVTSLEICLTALLLISGLTTRS